MIMVKPTSRAVRMTFHNFRLAAASKPYNHKCTLLLSFLRSIKCAHTVVGSSKNTNAGLAINAKAALTLRLFPPLRHIEIKFDVFIVTKYFTLDFVLFDFHKFQDRRYLLCFHTFLVFPMLLHLSI